MKRNCLILAVMSSLVALMLTISGCSTRSEAKTTAPLPSVNVVKLTVQDVPAYSEWESS